MNKLVDEFSTVLDNALEVFLSKLVYAWPTLRYQAHTAGDFYKWPGQNTGGKNLSTGY
jgi:hypothetical protein